MGGWVQRLVGGLALICGIFGQTAPPTHAQEVEVRFLGVLGLGRDLRLMVRHKAPEALAVVAMPSCCFPLGVRFLFPVLSLCSCTICLTHICSCGLVFEISFFFL